MRRLHIVQGGIGNGDKAWLESAAGSGMRATHWVVPKTAAIGDEVVIYVGGWGFFATTRIKSVPKPRENWPHRYGAAIGPIKLIKPPISLGFIQRDVPGLTWANYPRSITTPPPKIADQIRELIREPPKVRLSRLDDQILSEANIDELRELALLASQPSVAPKKNTTLHRRGSQAVHRYVLCRANGRCEGCDAPAPFRTRDGSAYLEPHHTTRLADEGPDHPANVIGLCPNCHRAAHYAGNAKSFNAKLVKRSRALWSRDKRKKV